MAEGVAAGNLYRGRSFYDGTQSGMGGSVLADEAGNQMEWTCVSEDGTKAVGMLMQKLVVPNHAAADLLSEGIAVGCPLPFLQPEIKI